MKRFFISTPIYYVNAKPHLGHAYTSIVADTLSRFHKAMGEETFFLTGTDEHGDKIIQAAEKGGKTPQEYVDEISALFKGVLPGLGVENDKFVRTTFDYHKKCVQAVLQKVYDAGDIYFGEYGGHYCYGCERFYSERELTEDGLCPQHLNKPEFIQEKNYFFRMSKHQDWLLEHIRQNPDYIRPQRYRNEVVSLLESGVLEDLCISRPKSRLTWGVELPFDTDFVCYVWFDALLNYVSALGWPDGENFAKFWPAAQHLVAKDILKPHAVFWPTMLRAAGFEPYQHLNVHGYWLIKDTKMSKSLGNVVEPLDMAGKYGLDAFRYFLLREMHFGHDASFSEEGLVARLNSDLANDLGNLFNRTLSMTHKFLEGVIPEPTTFEEVDEEIKTLGLDASRNFQTLFDRVEFSKGLESLWELVRALNRYIDQTQPWALNKAKETERLATVMYVLLESMRKVAAHLWPVMPNASGLMLEQLGCGAGAPALVEEIDTWGLLKPGNEVAKTSNLFPRVDLEAEADATQDKPGKKDKQAKKAKPAKEAKAEADDGMIEFEDFAKVDLRIGTVLKAVQHPNADKLYFLEVDLGEPEPRQIVSGLAGQWGLGDLIGLQVVVAANLKPRKLRGVLSHGMVLAVRTEEGLRLLTTTGPAPGGAKVT